MYGQSMPVDKRAEEEKRKLEADIDETVLEDPFNLPITHEVELRGHEGHVTALALGVFPFCSQLTTTDRSGSRLASGGYDSVIKLWDFNAMDQKLNSFRKVEPETDVVCQLNFSPTGDRFIMVGKHT